MSKSTIAFQSAPFERSVPMAEAKPLVASPPLDPVAQLFPEDENLATPVYAIPEELLNDVLDVIPQFMTDEEERAERQFARWCRNYCCIGITCGRGIQHLGLDVPKRLRIRTRQFESLGWHQFFSLAKANELIRLALDWADPVRTHLVAYVGWLMTNRQFLSERDRLRARWGTLIDALGQIPEYPLRVDECYVKCTAVGAKDVTDVFIRDFREFYRRWCLLGFATWDLPKPRGANIGGPPELSKLVGIESEPVVQTSPVIRLSPRYPISAILKSVASATAPDHLAEWFAVLDQRQQNNLRFHRFRQIFWLRFYRDAVLASRYGDRFDGNVAPLDEAFGRFLSTLEGDSSGKLEGPTDSRSLHARALGVDAVKKLRLLMNARLDREAT